MCPGTRGVSEISNPKLTIKCFTMDHRLFVHNENYIIVSSYLTFHVHTS